jgi:hypothetical protein
MGSPCSPSLSAATGHAEASPLAGWLAAEDTKVGPKRPRNSVSQSGNQGYGTAEFLNHDTGHILLLQYLKASVSSKQRTVAVSGNRLLYSRLHRTFPIRNRDSPLDQKQIRVFRFAVRSLSTCVHQQLSISIKKRLSIASTKNVAPHATSRRRQHPPHRRECSMTSSSSTAIYPPGGFPVVAFSIFSTVRAYLKHLYHDDERER